MQFFKQITKYLYNLFVHWNQKFSQESILIWNHIETIKGRNNLWIKTNDDIHIFFILDLVDCFNCNLASTWKNSVNAAIGDVGMLLSSCALKSQNSKENVLRRTMCASFNGNSCTIIISFYSPNNASDETDIMTFCNELFSLVRHIPKHIVIIGAVRNAQTNKDGNNKFCLYKLLNRKGEYLVVFFFFFFFFFALRTGLYA